MRKLTLFLSVFLLSYFYTNAQECGTIDFPRVIADSVCTSDTILLATDQEIGQNDLFGKGVFYDGAYYLNPNADNVGQRIYVKISGLDTCNQLVQDSVSVFVRNCIDCNPIKDPETVPESVCRNADPFVVASYYDGFTGGFVGGPISVEGDGITVEMDFTDAMNYWWYFYPDSVVGDEAHLKFTDSSTCEIFINKTIIMKDCSAPCETVSFLNSLPDSICNNNSSSIYLTSTTLYDAPIKVSGEGIYSEAQNGGLDSAYYFDPSLVNPSYYNQYFNIVIEAYDSCQSQALESIMVYDCVEDPCDTIHFETALPDTVCNSDDKIYLTETSLFTQQINVDGIGVVKEYSEDSTNVTYYFDPSAVLYYDYNYPTLIRLNVNGCNAHPERIVVKNCYTSCDTVRLENDLPEWMCIDDEPFYLTSDSLYDFPFEIRGNSVVKQPVTEGKGFSYYLDPSKEYQDHMANIRVLSNNACPSYYDDSLYIARCLDSCKAFTAFEYPLPDTLCITDDQIMLGRDNFFLKYSSTSPGVYIDGAEYAYFNPWSFNKDTLIKVGLTAINYCDTFYVEQQVFVDDCKSDCGTPQFANALPDEICSDDPAIYLTSTELFDFPIKVTGEGVVRQSLNSGLDSAYYFDPSMVGGSLPQYPHVYITALDDCRFYVQDSTIISSCMDTCSAPTEFEYPLPDTICSSDEKILIANDGIYNYEVFFEYVVEENNSFYFDPSLVSNVPREITVSLAGDKDCIGFFEIQQQVYINDCKVDSCVEFSEFLNPIPDTICSTADPILIANGYDFELIIPNNKTIEKINGDYYFNPSLTAVDSAISFGLTVYNSCQDSFYVEQQYVYIENCEPDCGTPQFTNALPEEVCNNDPRIYLTSTEAYDFSITVAGNGVISEAINGGSDTTYYFDPASVSGGLPQYPLIIIRAEDDCRNYALDSAEVKTCIDSCTIVPDFPYPLPDSICYSTSPIIFDFLINALDVWGDGIMYDGEIGFDPSVPAMNHYAVVYASVENACNEDVVVSDTVFINACNVSALNDFTGENIEIYPNPVSDQLTISGEGIKLVQIKDITGKTVLIQENTKLDVSGLANGIYFVQIELQNGVVKTEKVVKK